MPPKKPSFKMMTAFCAKLSAGIYLSGILCVVLTFGLAVGLGTGHQYVLYLFAMVIAILGMVVSVHIAERKLTGAKIIPFELDEITFASVATVTLVSMPSYVLFEFSFYAGELIVSDIADNISRISVDIPTIALGFTLYAVMAIAFFAPACFALFVLLLFIYWLSSRRIHVVPRMPQGRRSR